MLRHFKLFANKTEIRFETEVKKLTNRIKYRLAFARGMPSLLHLSHSTG